MSGQRGDGPLETELGKRRGEGGVRHAGFDPGCEIFGIDFDNAVEAPETYLDRAV